MDVQDFIGALRTATQAVLTQSGSQPWNVDLQQGGDATSHTIEFTLSGARNGKLAFSFSEPHALELARSFAGDILEGTTWSEDHGEALLECIRQIVGAALAQTNPGQDIKTASRWASTLEWTPSGTASLVYSAAERRGAMNLSWDGDLAGAPQNITAARHEGEEGYQRFALIEDVQLPVSLCFGRRKMLLRDVLDMRSGSVIELDQEVEAPVELLLDDRVIARGEVVIVDGSYGLRVLDIPGAER
jgi:flagellar motor switch protein FliN/FliY